jgi:hypothetical protein
MLAYDAYQEHERQKMLETLPPPANCSTCALHKADQKRLREYNAKRSLLEKSANADRFLVRVAAGNRELA